MLDDNDFDLEAFTNSIAEQNEAVIASLESKHSNSNSNSNSNNTANIDNLNNEEWVPEGELASLIDEDALGKTYAANVQTEFDRNAPLVAKSMVRLAIRGKSEATRLTAGKYILDKVFENKGASSTPMDDLLTEILDYTIEQASADGTTSHAITNTAKEE